MKREGLKPEQCKVGTVVFYASSPGLAWSAVVTSEPWEMPSGTWVCHLSGLHSAYGVARGDGRRKVPAAGLFALRLAPTEYLDGKWVFATHGSNPQGFIVHRTDTGWGWWANGSAGCAESYEDCRAAVEANCEMVKRSAESARAGRKLGPEADCG